MPPHTREDPGAARQAPLANDGAREPAPGEADPLAEDTQRDRRAGVWGTIRGEEDGWSDTS